MTERPAYRILSTHGFFGPDDNLYDEGECIYFDGEPNEEMEPLNEAARRRTNEYFEKLDALGKAAAEKAGRSWTGRPRSLEGALTLARMDEELKLKVRGAEKDLSAVGIERVAPDQIPEVGNHNPKRGPGRPKYKNVEIVQN